MHRTTLPLALTLLALAASPAAPQPVLRLPERDRPLTLTPTDIALIGTAEGESWEMFSGMVRVAFDARENLYVADSGEGRVLVFDRAGRYVRTIGRKGNGPGELMTPLGLVVLADGRVVVNDLSRRGFQVFAADGAFLESIPLDLAEGLPSSDIRAAPGGIVGELRRLPLRLASDQDLHAAGRPVALRPLRADGAWKTLLEAPADGEPTVVRSGGSGGGTMAVSTAGARAFAPRFVWDLLPGGGLVAGWEAEYRLRLTDPEGGVRAIVERLAVAPRKVTAADREAYRRTLESSEVVVTGGGPAAAMAAQMREQRLANLTFADVLPAVARVMTDPWGRIWVQRTGGADGAPGPIDLLTAEGEYIGTLPPQRLPDAMGVGGRLAYVERDADTGIVQVRIRQMKDGRPPEPVRR